MSFRPTFSKVNFHDVSKFSLAGVTEAMLREAYPGGVPDTAFSGTVDLTSDNEEEDIKTEIKEEGE